MLTLVDPQLLESLRDELAVQKKVGEAQAELVRSLQGQLVQVKLAAEQNTQRDGDGLRQVHYLTQQREELQQKIEDLLLQQHHWQEQQEQWREKEKQRKVPHTFPSPPAASLPSSSHVPLTAHVPAECDCAAGGAARAEQSPRTTTRTPSLLSHSQPIHSIDSCAVLRSPACCSPRCDAM